MANVNQQRMSLHTEFKFLSTRLKCSARGTTYFYTVLSSNRHENLFHWQSIAPYTETWQVTPTPFEFPFVITSFSLNCIIFRKFICITWPSLWSSNQSSWLQIQSTGFNSWRYQIFWEVVGLERGPLSHVSTTEDCLKEKVAAPI
jgi:hypothetical protein